MSRLSRIIVTFALGAVAFGTVFAPAARASCTSLDEKGQAIWRLPAVNKQPVNFGFVVAKFVLDASASDASIVGFWHVALTADGADKPFDSALVQFHSDGNEITNSSKDPRTQSFCLGVWQKTGAFAYTVKHLAMSWDGIGNAVGPATILENITLDHHGDTFTGTFVLTQYGMDGTTVVPPAPGAPAAPVTGTLSGTRITAN
jgi:hypothetical protein